MLRELVKGLALGAMAGTPFLAAAIGAQGDPAGSITLYNGEDLTGTGVTITKSTPDLQAVAAAEGFDGTANDYAFSIRTEGRWQVCMDAGYRTSCMVVDGEMSSLGDRGGSISSVRYLGQSQRAAVAAPMSPAPAPRADEDWQPMYNVDLFGNDYREIVYTSAGNSWQTCKAACDGDRQCAAWTYVPPGRTDHGECFLKAPVPEPSQSECCISGIKGAPGTRSAGGRDEAVRPLGRLGETAADAAEDELNQAVDRKVRGLLGELID